MSGIAGWIDEGAWVQGHDVLGARPSVVETAAGPVIAASCGWVGDRGESLADAYLRWGDALAERLDGGFSFAIWDGRSRRLLLGRDRLGIKPLYYAPVAGGVLFASRPGPILRHPRFSPRLDPTRLTILLQPRLALAGETPVLGLHEVAPAHVVTCAGSTVTARRYWQLRSAPHPAAWEETVATTRALLDDAVGRELVTGAPRAAMLSGGVDSTSVAALAVRALRRDDPGATLDTFCVRFADDGEHFVATELRPDLDAPYAAAAAAHLGSRHHTLTITVDELTAAVPETRRARDLPGWGQFDASMYLLFRAMQPHTTAALTGEAADEIFGGYPYCFNPELLQERGRFPWLGNAPRLADYLAPDVRRHVDPAADERDRLEQLLARVPRLPGEDAAAARMREVLFLGMCGPLAVILDRKERMSAACGVDVRVPFCDHRLVEYVWNVPWELKARGGVKGLLKAAMADLLPAATVERKKSAYPHVHSPAHDRALVREARRIAGDRSSPVAALFDTARLAGLIDELDGGAAAGAGRMFPGGASPAYLLIHLVELERWIEDYRIAC